MLFHFIRIITKAHDKQNNQVSGFAAATGKNIFPLTASIKFKQMLDSLLEYLTDGFHTTLTAKAHLQYVPFPKMNWGLWIVGKRKII